VDPRIKTAQGTTLNMAVTRRQTNGWFSRGKQHSSYCPSFWVQWLHSVRRCNCPIHWISTYV